MCAATDSTWRWTEHCWIGKCIHCRRKVSLGKDGATQGGATLEHIVPRTHGGSNELSNLSIACSRCNHQKGRKLDVLHLSDTRLQDVIVRLQQRKENRCRAPIDTLAYLFEPRAPRSSC